MGPTTVGIIAIVVYRNRNRHYCRAKTISASKKPHQICSLLVTVSLEKLQD